MANLNYSRCAQQNLLRARGTVSLKEERGEELRRALGRPPVSPFRPQPSKAALRAKAEAAVLEWKRRPPAPARTTERPPWE